MLRRRWIVLAAYVAAWVSGCEHLTPWSADDPKEKAVKAAVKERERAKEKEKETPRVTHVFKEQIKLKPETLVAFAKLAEQDAIDKEDPGAKEAAREKARLSYRRALDIDKHCLEAHLGLARMWEASGNHDRAVESFGHALKLQPKDASIWVEVGMIHARNREWQWSLDCLKKAAEMDPDNKSYAITYGLALARAGRFDDSLPYLRRGGKGEAEAQCLLAQMLHHIGQDDSARERVQLALQADPTMQPARDLLERINGQAAAERVAAPTE